MKLETKHLCLKTSIYEDDQDVIHLLTHDSLYKREVTSEYMLDLFVYLLEHQDDLIVKYTKRNSHKSIWIPTLTPDNILNRK